MRQWRRLVLLGMLVWGLVFLALLSYILDTRVKDPLTSVGSPISHHPDTRRLASIMASRPGESASASEPAEPPSSSSSSVPGSPESSLEDPQSLAAWSSFGTENVGSHSRPGPQSRERTEYENRDGDEEENEDKGAGGDSSDQEEFYMQRLWRGRVSPSMLSSRLQNALKEYVASNKHQVSYKGPRRLQLNPNDLLCQMKAQARPRAVDGSQEPFSSLGWAHLVPPIPLERLSEQGGFKTCAVVTSAGTMLRSRLGKEIDAHDAVLRFNAAPTQGYERDVGNRTTIRIINSQILANPRFQFNSSSIYRNVTLVAWDPPPYTVDLHKWYQSPDYNLFGPYVERRQLQPQQNFYILHPQYIWSLWDLVQGNTQETIQPNPPSSGFMGILLMMALCEQVHVYEYIPSTRQTNLCHYHEQYYDDACTLGAYHPLLFEKNLIQRINLGPETDLRRKGRVTLPGLSTVHCDTSTLPPQSGAPPTSERAQTKGEVQ